MILKDSHGSWTFVTLLLFQWHDENLRDTIASLLARGAINAGRREEGGGGYRVFVCLMILTCGGVSKHSQDIISRIIMPWHTNDSGAD